MKNENEKLIANENKNRTANQRQTLAKGANSMKIFEDDQKFFSQ